MTTIIYIHGFNSSPSSQKARLTGEWLAAHHPDVDYLVPSLPFDPEAVAGILERTLSQVQGEVGLIGSSMGGFYSLWLAERFDCRAVLVNPAVSPHLLLKDYLGEQVNAYTGERYGFTERDIRVLESQLVPVPRHPERLWLLTQQGDETLDWRDAVNRYPQLRSVVESGGSHGFDGYERFLPSIYQFLTTGSVPDGSE